MKKTVLLLLSLYCFVFADTVPRIAVYASGSSDAAVNEALSDLVLDALVKSGLYRSIDKPQEFAAKTMRGADSVLINDSLVTELGKTAGAEYLCFVKILAVLGSNQISARIVGVEGDYAAELGVAASPLAALEDLQKVSLQITERLRAEQNTETAQKSAAAAEQTAAKTDTSAIDTPQKQAEEKSNEETVFTDPRDNREYSIKRIGSYFWFMQDIAHGGKEKYTWNEACGICPQGWRLPDNKEWNELKKTLLTDELKEFTEKSRGNWWSATENGRGFAWFWYFSRNKLRSSVGMDYVGKANAYGVRCVSTAGKQ